MSGIDTRETVTHKEIRYHLAFPNILKKMSFTFLKNFIHNYLYQKESFKSRELMIPLNPDNSFRKEDIYGN